MHHVLSIPELLAIIFSFLPRKQNQYNRLVCKRWLLPALDATWRVVTDEDLTALFRILAPLEGESGERRRRGSVLHFSRTPTAKDWERFDPYRRRVKDLTFGLAGRHGLERSLSLDVFKVIRRTRITEDVFPNLKSYSFGSAHRYASLFMHAGVKEVHVKLQSLTRHTPPPDHGEILHTIGVLMPNIVDLTVTANNETYHGDFNAHMETSSVWKDEEHLCDLVSGLPSLRYLVLPQFWMTTSIMDAAATLPRLGIINVALSDPGNPLEAVHWHPLLLRQKLDEEQDLRRQQALLNETQPIPTASPTPPPPLFPSLKALVVTARFDDVRDFLVRACHISPGFSTRLQYLIVNSPIIETRESLSGLIETLSESFPNILKLDLVPSVSAPHMPNGTQSTFPPPPSSFLDPNPSDAKSNGWSLKDLLPYRISLSDIQPLFKLKHLRSLELQHHLPAAFSLKDLEKIGQGFRKLETLVLFSTPCPLRSVKGANDAYSGRFLDVPKKGGGSDSDGERQEGDDEEEEKGFYARNRILGLRDTLRTLGTACPKLQTLGVYVCVDADSEVNQVEDWGSSKGTSESTTSTSTTTTETTTPLEGKPGPLSPYFQHLKSIDFGSSSIVGYEPHNHYFPTTASSSSSDSDTDTETNIGSRRSRRLLTRKRSPRLGSSSKTALVLSEYLKKGTKIKAGVSWGSEDYDSEWNSAYMKRLRVGGRRDGFGVGASMGGGANNGLQQQQQQQPPPAPAPVYHPFVHAEDEDSEPEEEEPEFNPDEDIGREDWMNDAAGVPIPPDIVLETNESGDPLVNGLEPLANHLGVNLDLVREANLGVPLADGPGTGLGASTPQAIGTATMDVLSQSRIFLTLLRLWKQPVPGVFLSGLDDQGTRSELRYRKERWKKVGEVLESVITLRENERRRRWRMKVAVARAAEGGGGDVDVDVDVDVDMGDVGGGLGGDGDGDGDVDVEMGGCAVRSVGSDSDSDF